MLNRYGIWACPVPGCPKVSVHARITCTGHGRRMVKVVLQPVLRELEQGEEGFFTRLARRAGL